MHMVKLALVSILSSLFRHTHASGNPHTNQENIFSDYENCINRKVDLLQQSLGKPTPQAILSQIGDDVKMTCDTWWVD